MTELTNEKIDEKLDYILKEYFNDCWKELQDEDYPTQAKLKAHIKSREIIKSLIHQAEITARLHELKALQNSELANKSFRQIKIRIDGRVKALEKEIVC